MAGVNYDDERFQQVTREQNAALDNLNNTYNNMINQSQQFYDAQARAAEDYGNRQAALQQQNTDFVIEKINQQKDQAEKDYTKEQKGAYVDWQKQSNQYGVNAEIQAQQGLRNGGYSESSQVSMYNQYQNRVATARDSYNRAVLEYDNGIKEAQLTNNTKLAEIAYNALKTKLELNLQGFQYKNQLLANQISQTQALKDTYYNRWKDVLSQINTENALAEQQRQFNEQMALQQAARTSSSIRTSGGSGGRGYTVKSGGNNSAKINQNDVGGYANTNGNLASEPIRKINGVSYIPVDGMYADNGSPIYKAGGKLYYWDGKKMVYGGNASSSAPANGSVNKINVKPSTNLLAVGKGVKKSR